MERIGVGPLVHAGVVHLFHRQVPFASEFGSRSCRSVARDQSAPNQTPRRPLLTPIRPSFPRDNCSFVRTSGPKERKSSASPISAKDGYPGHRELMRRSKPVASDVQEIVDGVYRLCTLRPGTVPISFNQFLIDDEKPTLIHTGYYESYDLVRAAV